MNTWNGTKSDWIETFHSKLYGWQWTVHGIILDYPRNTAGIVMEYSWYSYGMLGLRTKKMWNMYQLTRQSTWYILTFHISTHNWIPHNLYYTTYYPWRVAVRITVMCVICGTSSDTLILQPYSILTPAAFHYDTTCMPLWHQLYSIITPAQQSINHQYSQATPTFCVFIDSTDNL